MGQLATTVHDATGLGGTMKNLVLMLITVLVALTPTRSFAAFAGATST